MSSFAGRRGRHEKGAGMAAKTTAAAVEPDKKDTSGAVQTEESPKRDDADAKPFGTSKHSVYFPTSIARVFARLVLKIQKFVCRCIFI